MIGETCPTHPEKLIQWHCDTCRATLCEACGAGAFQGKVYCSKCLPSLPSVSAVPAPASASERGLGLGIALAFLLPILGSVLLSLLSPLIAGVVRGLPWLWWLWWGFSLLPYVTALVITKQTGRRGVFKGLLIGLVIQVGLVLLLMAACFGIFR